MHNPTVDKLLQHVAEVTTLTADLQAELQCLARYEEIKRGDFLHRSGAVCNRTYFITQGLIRSYYEKGEKEITDFFAAEGDWITAPASFMKNEADLTYLQALEPSQVCSLTNVELQQLFERYPAMERFGRIIISRQFVQLSTRLTAMQFSLAKDKYAHFCAAYQPILARLPLGMVASYLGITQETMSRVRAQK